MPTGNFIEIPTRGKRFDWPQSLIPASADNPFSGLSRINLRTNPLAELVEGPDALDVHAKLLQARVGEMQVCVVETRHDEMSVEIDHLRLISFELLEIECLAN